MNNYYVYVHKKADTGEVFYVGKGKGKRAYTKDSRNPHWRNIVAKHGFEVRIVAEGMTNEEALLLEVQQIANALSDGCILANVTKGGDFNPMLCEEVIKARSGENHWAYGLTGENNPTYGRKDTPEIVEAKRQRMLGRKMGACSEERKEKIRQAKLGKTVADTSKYHWERERIECPHCGKDGIVSNMKRWHFDNCKMKEAA